jgi:hypothetical protein
MLTVSSRSKLRKSTRREVVLLLFHTRRPSLTSATTMSLYKRESNAGLNGCLPGPDTGPDTPYCALQQDIECFALPYGTSEFVSDLISVFTVLMLYFGRRPSMLWSKLEGKSLNFILAALLILGSTISTIINVVHCRHRWDLIVVSMWKMILSISLGLMAIHAASIARDYDAESRQAVKSFVPYIIGVVVGHVGLAHIPFTVGDIIPDHIKPSSQEVIALWMAMFTLPILMILIFMALQIFQGDWRSETLPSRLHERMMNPHSSSTIVSGGRTGAAFYVIFFWGLNSALFGSWILAVITENTLGKPSSASKFDKGHGWNYVDVAKHTNPYLLCTLFRSASRFFSG